MTSGTRLCQNCKKNFTIEADDFTFYEKIKVPPPTWCPRCRTIRRFMYRNERSLHRRKCDAPGHSEEILSMYAPGVGRVYDYKYWWSDEWDPMVYGREYDFSKSFFEQFNQLRNEVPLPNLSVVRSVNSDYSNWTDGNKNCYLAFAAGYNEDVRFVNKSLMCRDSQDMLYVGHNELCHEVVNCYKCNRVLFSQNCKACTDSAFLYDCRSCTDCFMCSNLVGKSFYFNNRPCSKEEYKKLLSEIDLGSRKNIENLQQQFADMYTKAIHRYATIFASNNCTGNDINNSKNAKESFELFEEVEDSKYLVSCLISKSIYDSMGSYKVELGYEAVDNNEDRNVIGSIVTYTSHDVAYGFSCHSSSNLFGCVSLRNKEFCILNRQYQKEDYKNVKDKIVVSMGDAYGSFFPPELSPFAYNETIAQEYFPLTKEQAISQGYRWKDPETRNYQVTMPNDQIPDNIKDVQDSILKDIIACQHAGSCTEQCTTAFRIIPQELQFYKRMNLPLPRLCPNCRHYQRLKQRNPLKLWHRKCMNPVRSDASNGMNPGCQNEFETSYAPDRPEIVYCESCYQKEVI